MSRTFYVFVLLMALVSCAHKNELPKGIAIGQTEAEWRSAVSSLVAAKVFTRRLYDEDTTYRGKVQLGDSSYEVEATFNHDDIRAGNLRIVTYQLGTERSNVDPQTQNGHGLGAYLNRVPEELCRKSVADKIQRYLDRTYGKPDSLTVSDKPLNWDSSYWYSSGSYVIRFHKGGLNPSNDNYSGYFYDNPQLIYYEKGYASDQARLTDAIRKKLHPQDVVNVPFRVFKEASLEYPNGLTYPGLILAPEAPLSKCPFERRLITAVKGRLVLTDRFGTELYVESDYEYVPTTPFKYSSVNLRLPSSMSSGRTLRIFLFRGRAETAKLKDAYEMDKDIKAQFIPEAISFSDGSVMR